MACIELPRDAQKVRFSTSVTSYTFAVPQKLNRKTSEHHHGSLGPTCIHGGGHYLLRLVVEKRFRFHECMAASIFRIEYFWDVELLHRRKSRHPQRQNTLDQHPSSNLALHEPQIKTNDTLCLVSLHKRTYLPT